MSNITRIALAALGILLLLQPAAAQPVLDQSHSDPICGFLLSYPSGWRAEPASDKVLHLINPDDSANFDVVAVYDEDLSAPARIRSASGPSVAANYVLGRKEVPVWIDRFSEQSVTVTYVIYRRPPLIHRPPHQIGDETREHYVLAAAVIADRSTRVPGAVGWSLAVMGFWVLPERFRELEPILMSMLRSFQFTRPEHDCVP